MSPSSAGDRDLHVLEKPLYAEVPRWRVTQALRRTSIAGFSAGGPLSFVEFPPPQYDDQATTPLPWQQSPGGLDPDGLKQGINREQSRTFPKKCFHRSSSSACAFLPIRQWLFSCEALFDWGQMPHNRPSPCFLWPKKATPDNGSFLPALFQSLALSAPSLKRPFYRETGI